MSSITNYVNTVWRVRNEGVQGALGGMNRGISTIAGNVEKVSTASGRLNNQWKAIGTTMRYAIAGGAVFGTARLISNLGEIQRQIGMLQALGGATNGILPGMSGSGQLPVTSLLQQARDSAVNAVTPVNEFNEGLINLYSSIQNVPNNQAARMMEEISKTAQFAQTDATNVSKAVFGMMQTFNMTPNLSNVQKYTRVIAELVSQVPGGPEAAAQMFTQFPQLAASFSLGRGTPQDMFGLYMRLLRSGGSPATAGRGLQFLAQTVATPAAQTKGAQVALRQAGVDQNFITEHGTGRAILAVIAHAKSLGLNVNRGRVKGATDDNISQLFGEDALASTSNLSSIGISGAGAEYLAHALRRIHAIRAAVLLGNVPQGTTADLRATSDAFNGTADAIQNYNKQMENLTKGQQVRKAGIALQGVAQQVSLGLEPLINPVAAGVQHSAHFLNHHPGIVKTGVTGAAIIGALYGTNRFIRGGGHFLTRGMAVEAASHPTGVLGQSPQNPMYVMVVDQLFNRSTNPPGPHVPTPVPWRQKLMNPFTKFGMLFGLEGADAALAGTGIGLPLAVLLASAYMGRHTYGTGKNPVDRNRLAALQGKQGNLAKRMQINSMLPLTPGGSIMDTPLTNNDPFSLLNTARGMFGQNVYQLDNVRQKQMNGHAEVFMTIDIRRPDGSTERKRVHVPLDLILTAPSSRGKKPARK